MTVFIVDDDPSVRDALGLLLGVHGYRIALFASGEDFLAAWRDSWVGCVLVDIRMPGMDGLALQQALIARGCTLPLIIISGHGDVESARAAFKAQARDFLQKPLAEDKLIKAIEDVFAEVRETLAQRRQRAQARALLPSLTPRESQIMQLVVDGQHNRDIALALGISARTVEVHKARLMSKLGVGNVADLVRLCMSGEAG